MARRRRMGVWGRSPHKIAPQARMRITVTLFTLIPATPAIHQLKLCTTTPTNKNNMTSSLSLADLPSARLHDLCAAANAAAEAHASPKCVFALPEGTYAFGPVPSEDLKKIECYLAALVAAHDDDHATRSKHARLQAPLRLLTHKIKPRECDSADWRVYDAARKKVHDSYPGTFQHAAAMQASVVSYFAFAPATLAAWPAYIDFPAPRTYTVHKDRALALHARETHLRALMYTILCTDARALAKCRFKTPRADEVRARALLDIARVQQYVMLNSAVAGNTKPHEYDDATTIREASLKRTRATVHAVHRQAKARVEFESSEDDHSSSSDEEERERPITELELRYNKLVAADLAIAPQRPRSPSPPHAFPLLSNTPRPRRKRACKA